jgi:hypothetical protein
MADITIPSGRHLYDAMLHHTSIVEYGFGVADLDTGRTLPPAGARIDIAFEGRIEGDRIAGTIAGVDFGEVRADGRFDLHIHATITTDDGAHISFFADGIFRPSDGELRENVRLTTASTKYAWVNQLQIWARGNADMRKRKVCVKAYVA